MSTDNPYASPQSVSQPDSRLAMPILVRGIAVMTLAGGILAGVYGLVLFAYGTLLFAARIGFGCLMLPSAVHSVVLGALAVRKGVALLRAGPQSETAPTLTAIMQFVNIIACDFINLLLGISVVCLLNDPQIRTYYRN
jgi:hypothetical protein